MAKNFKNVKSFEDLKSQYKQLLKANHPDNGGDVSKMQEINVEYDALFKIWKDRHEATTGEKVTETADSTRSQFYTAFGWEGKNHDWNRSLKEIAVIVRSYVKEKYPTYKFSVRTSYASMCQELHVSLKEAPADIYNRNPETWTDEQRHSVKRRFEANWIMDELTCWYESELTDWLKTGLAKVNYSDFYTVKNEAVQAMFNDVDAFVKSYNFEDCDGMTDYFHVDFYYFGVSVAHDLKIVPKTARIKKQTNEPAKATNSEKCYKDIPCCGCAHMETCTKSKATTSEPKAIEQKAGYTYKIAKGEDTRDGSELWVVRIVESLTKDEYIRINKAIQAIGGYYSKFKHGFIFRFEPSEKLQEVA